MSVIYFGTFYVMVNLFIIKMMVGVVIENYTWVHSMDIPENNEKGTSVSFEDLYRFNEIWELFDPEQKVRVRVRVKVRVRSSLIPSRR